MSRLSITEKGRRILSPAQWIAVATFLVFGLSAAAATAAPQLIEICQKGHTIKVDVHAVPALLDQGARLGSCEGGGGGCACSQEFDPVTCSDGKTYANVPDINELFEIGLNRAVTLIAEKRAGKGAGRGRNTIAPLKELGNHPDGEPINLFNGRFGPYLKHGTINATIPRGADPASITLEQAIELVDTRAAAAPSTKMKGKKKAAKPAAKKAEAKPTGDSKSTTKKPAAKAAAKTAKPAAA